MTLNLVYIHLHVKYINIAIYSYPHEVRKNVIGEQCFSVGGYSSSFIVTIQVSKKGTAKRVEMKVSKFTISKLLTVLLRSVKRATNDFKIKILCVLCKRFACHILCIYQCTTQALLHVFLFFQNCTILGYSGNWSYIQQVTLSCKTYNIHQRLFQP